MKPIISYVQAGHSRPRRPEAQHRQDGCSVRARLARRVPEGGQEGRRLVGQERLKEDRAEGKGPEGASGAQGKMREDENPARADFRRGPHGGRGRHHHRAGYRAARRGRHRQDNRQPAPAQVTF